MPMTVGTSGGNKVVNAMAVGTSGGNKVVLQGYVGTSGGNKLFFSSLSASVSPTIATGSSSSGAPATTNVVAVTPAGGVSPYGYSWARISGSSDITAGLPTNAATGFSVASNSEQSATFRCTVTDDVGATAFVDVPVSFTIV